MAKIVKVTDLITVEPLFLPPKITAIPENRTDVTINGIEIVLDGQLCLSHQKPIPDSSPLVHPQPRAISKKTSNFTINNRYVITDDDFLLGPPGCVNWPLQGNVTFIPPVDIVVG